MSHYEMLMTKVTSPLTVEIRLGFNWHSYYLLDTGAVGPELDDSPVIRMTELDDNIPRRVQARGLWYRVLPT